ncbi:MAG: hypothetical protein AB7R55_03905 [Gemmatimonadales bacterium]
MTISGKFRVKVGDNYQYTATAKLSDGTEVNRPVSWGVSDPSAATMTAGGSMVPLKTGVITIEVTIDGVVWVTTATAYDWIPFGSGSTFGIGLTADVLVSNKFGSMEYPNLGMGCSGGLFLLFVDTDNFVTPNGLVTYSFDGGTARRRGELPR